MPNTARNTELLRIGRKKSALRGQKIVIKPDALYRVKARVARSSAHNLAQREVRNPARISNGPDLAPRLAGQVLLQKLNGIHMASVPDPAQYATTHSAHLAAYALLMGKKDLRTVLADNVQRLLDYADERALPWAGIRGLARAAGMSCGNIERILVGRTSIGLNIVEKLAAGCKRVPYQLLIPNLDPENPPWIPVTEEEKKIAAILRLSLSQLENERGESAGEDHSGNHRGHHDLRGATEVAPGSKTPKRKRAHTNKT